jgi:hypothetical protein
MRNITREYILNPPLLALKYYIKDFILTLHLDYEFKSIKINFNLNLL